MKNILKSFAFLFILFLLIEGIAISLIPGFNVKKYGVYKTASYEILWEKENTIDVIALGDSLIYSSLSPMEVWNRFGYTVFDCSESAQMLPNAYKYLEVAIASQHPKIVLMEANVLYRENRKQKWKKRVSKTVRNYVPIAKYHDNWKKYISDGPKKDWVNTSKGYKYITKVEPSEWKDYMKHSDKVHQMPAGNSEYLEKILKLCKENDVKLVLVSFPSQTSWNYKKHAGMVKIAEKYHLEFIDLNLEDLGIDWTTDTKDEGSHLNYLGAKKVSQYIGNYLESTGLVDDHRNDSSYHSWNKAYKRYLENSKKN